MTEQTYTTRAIAEALGITQQAVDKRAKREGWPFEYGKGRGGRRRLYEATKLPTDVQAALLVSDRVEPTPTDGPSRRKERRASYSYDPKALWHWAGQRPQHLQDEGRRRAEILDQVMTLQRAGSTFRVAADMVARRRGDVSAASIRNWFYGINGTPGARNYERHDWAAALIPRYSGRASEAKIPHDAWQYWLADYLRPEAPTAESCHRRLVRVAKDHGWHVPSSRTLLRRTEREIGRPGIVLARQGAEALRRMYPAQERDRTVFRALQGVNADGHKFDVFVMWPDGTIDRPMMVAWQDLYSGKILAWRVGRTENTDSYRLSMHDLLRDYGVCSAIWVDNGRGIASKYLTGGTPTRYRFKVRREEPIGLLTHLVGSENIHWTTPYSGQSKPIERAFRDMADDIAKDPRFAGAYTGNLPTAKPENYGKHAVDIETFLQVVEEGIKEHNARPGRRSAICQGRSFDQVFWESYQENAHEIPKPTDQQLRQWLLAAEGVTADRQTGAIRLLGNRFWDESLAPLAGLPAARRKVIAYFDPDHLHQGIHVYALDGREIGFAECWHKTGFSDTDSAREHNRARTKFRKSTREQLVAQRQMDAAEAGELLDGTQGTTEDDNPTPPDTRVVRGAFRPRKRVAGSDVVPQHEEESEEEADERYGFSDLIEAQRQEWIKNQV